MAIRYSPEVHAFIRDHYKGRRIKELADLTNQKMGTTFTYTAMKAYLSNHKLRNGMPRGRLPGEWSKFPDGMEDYIRSVAPGMKSTDIATKAADHFGIEFTASQCRAYMKNHRIVNGLDCRFQKGHAPKNKGEKQSEFMSPEAIEKSKATRFQKGNTSQTYLPVGSITLTTDGYYKKKVADPNRWKLLHRLIWEENYGPIPEGMAVAFKDNNPKNCVVENLMLISLAENAVLNHLGYRSEHPELTKVGVTIAKIKIAQRKAQKRKGGRER